jgi:Bifunctional DNA primase/polymerase, N-terminal
MADSKNLRGTLRVRGRCCPSMNYRDGKCACGNADCSRPGEHPPPTSVGLWRALHRRVSEYVLKQNYDSAVPAAVLQAVERGWSVIPVRPDKTPVLSGWKLYQTSRATLQEIENWQTELSPATWAVVTGQISGIVILDFDGEKGRRTLERLRLNPHVETGSGGSHVYLEHPGWRVPTLNGKTKRTLGEAYPGLDIRADAGYAIFWGRNSSGPYKRLRPRIPDRLDLLPKKLRELLGLERAPTQGFPTSDGAVALKKGANSLLEEAFARISSEGRNNSGFRLARQLRDRRFAFDDAGRVMRQYAAGVPELNQKGQVEPYTESDALASLEQAYSREPRATPDQSYFATDEGLFWRKPSRDGESIVQLTNFSARIVEDVVTDDGVETRRNFKIGTVRNGRATTATVPAREFPTMSWVYDMLGPRAVMYAGLGIKDHTRTAIQLLSPKIVKSRVYTHTGWRELGDKWYYLHSGGAIGEEGLYEAKVILPPDLAFFNLPAPPKGDTLEEAVRASLSILELGPRWVTAPFYCGIWRSVIGTCDFSIHYAGPTGTFKTSLSALGQQHFGSGFDRLHPPASWESTENALQALQFFAKDAILLIDDFAPRGNKSDIERYHHKADRVLRGQGNNVGRARMKPDSSLRATKSARGMTLSTGEDVPKGESLKARLMILELERNTIDEARLKAGQEQGSAGLYCDAMAGFLSWLAPRYQSIVSKLPAKVAAWREKAARSDQHRRTPEMVANLMYGLSVFLRFCSEQNILSGDEVEDLKVEAWEALGLAAAAQAQEQRADEPTRRFLDLLSAALASGECQIKNARTGDSIRQSRGRCIGWRDGQYLLLEPDAAFAEAQRIASQQGDALPITKNTLWKRLNEKAVIARREKGRNLVKWRIAGVERRVVCLLATALPMEGSEDANE